MKLRALIVDDDRPMRLVLTQMLPLTGLAEFTFTEASDGREAWKKFNAKNTDIVFVDWNMPQMTGIDLIHKIRASDGTEHIPIVMVTGETRMGKIEEALDKAGADVYITKPFTVIDLRRQVEKPLQRIMGERAAPPESKPASLLGRLLGSQR